MEIMHSMLSNHNIIKLEISSRKLFGKTPSILKLNNIFLNNPWVKEEITRETEKYFELNKNFKTYQKV